MKKLLVLGLAATASSALFAGSTGFISTDDDIFLVGGTTYAFGATVLLGSFATTPASDVTFANAVGNFTEFARTSVLNSGGFPSFSGSYTTGAADAGKQVYMWILNTNPTSTTPTQQALFTSPAWTLTGASGSDVKALDIQTATTTIVGSKATIATIPTFTLAAVAVPEPSTYALMGLGLAVVGFMARRRK